MKGLRQVEFVYLQPNDPDWMDVETFDFTKLTAINTCPTWGILRYGMHKAMPGARRALALEAGKVAHDAFAAIRLYQLRGSHPAHWEYHGARIFGADRFTQIGSVVRDDNSDDANLRNACVEVIATSGYYDDPNDRRRTVANIEASAIAYAANYDRTRFPVWVREASDPSADVGIEIPFDIGMRFYQLDGKTKRIRFVGRIDGIHWHREVGGELLLQENKTAARLDDAWRMSFDMSHQVTGYQMAGRLFTGQEISRTVVLGVQIPLPRVLVSGLVDVWTRREQYHYDRWLEWMVHTLNLYREYQGNPFDAPKYTHSCNRYFRPCAFIPFCTTSRQEQEEIVREMAIEVWSPLEQEGEGGA